MRDRCCIVASIVIGGHRVTVVVVLRIHIGIVMSRVVGHDQETKLGEARVSGGRRERTQIKQRALGYKPVVGM